MNMVSVQDLKAALSSVIAAAESGQTIIITRHGKAVARLCPADPPHVHRGRLVGQPWPPAVTSGLGAHALATLLDDRADR
jgi:prevent-host-death family protein